VSLFSYLSSEVTRGYVLDHDEERYTTRRQKMYTFMKIPRELEKFMSYGFFHCLVNKNSQLFCLLVAKNSQNDSKYLKEAIQKLLKRTF
jgi:hypothetical protein